MSACSEISGVMSDIGDNTDHCVDVTVGVLTNKLCQHEVKGAGDIRNQ